MHRGLRMGAGIITASLLAACSSGGETAVPATTTIAAPPTEAPATSAPPTTAIGSGGPTLPAPSTTGTAVPSSVPVPRFVDENGFDDHSVPAVATVDELMALSRLGVGGPSSMKFTIPQFDRPADAPSLARAHLMDGNFYGLHDEWYWFRLLNGQPIPGAADAPVAGHDFVTIADIYDWARAQPANALPLGLRFFGERLYSSTFYSTALQGDPRSFGVGAIVRMPDPVAGRPDHWLIELEFSDVVTPQIVAQYFERLAPVLPADIGPRLEWVVRSPQHETVAEAMAAQQLPYHDRIVQYRDLVPDGEVAVYSEGITAGRLLYVGEDGAQLTDAQPGDIVITEHVPDWLPTANALITSDPQTPLAHVNLLARNRGMPNASMSGIHDNAGLRQATRVRAYAVVMARGSELEIALISREQYESWATGQTPAPVRVPPVDIEQMPYVLDLESLVRNLSSDGLTAAEVAEWTPIIGGKSAGFLTLLSTGGLTPPPDALAITVRAYVEHLAPWRDAIAALIGDPSLAVAPQHRWLVLEGQDDYADTFGTDADAAIEDAYLAAHPPGTPIGDVVAAGGIRGLLESIPIDPATLTTITTALESTYRDLDSDAGIRFRSSSSVEDIDGFNGAGLYTSYTGFLHPERLDDEDDRDNTVERAILRAWASYWSFEAYEERELAQIDHLSGAMGLTVHPRFDDDLERNNGVATFTYVPGRDGDAVLEINVQDGDTEVTNPDPADPHLPEIIRVTRRRGAVSIERIRASTLVDPGEQILTDADVRELFEQTAAVADVWRNRVNDSLSVPRRVQTVVLDFEFKSMAAGWPQQRDGVRPLPERLVLRQVRSLDPGLRALPAEVRALPVPLDVLMRAALVDRITCDGNGPDTVRYEVTTDPLLAPDLGYADVPLVVGRPATPADEPCTRRTMYVSRAGGLRAILSSPDAYVIVG